MCIRDRSSTTPAPASSTIPSPSSTTSTAPIRNDNHNRLGVALFEARRAGGTPSPGHTRPTACAPWGYLKSRPSALAWSSTTHPCAIGVASGDWAGVTIAPSESGFLAYARLPDSLGVTQRAALRASETDLIDSLLTGAHCGRLNYALRQVLGGKVRSETSTRPEASTCINPRAHWPTGQWGLGERMHDGVGLVEGQSCRAPFGIVLVLS